MKVLNILVISVSIFLFSTATFMILPSDALSKEKAASKLDCSWKCDKKKMECVCSGKDCQTCVGDEGKAYGGAMKVAIRTCRIVECVWYCAGYNDGKCSLWRQNCVEECDD